MSVPDLTDNRLYKKHGLNGLRWFAWIWFPFVYAALFGLSVTLFWLLEAMPRRESICIGTIGIIVLIAGIAMLTKMYREFRAGITAIELRDNG